MPKLRSAKDAFRKATPRKQLINNLMLNEYKGRALPPGTQMACVLVRALPTKTKAKFTHSNRAAIYLNAEGQIDTVYYGNLDSTEMDYLNNINDAFGRAKSQIDGSQIRDAIAKLLRKSHAVPFREGAYMIPDTQASLSTAMEALFPWLNNYTQGVNKLTSIEYVDTPKQRAQLEDVLAEFIDREVSSKIEQAYKYVAHRGNLHKDVGDRKRATTVGELMALNTLIGEYEGLLSNTLSELRRQTAYTADLTNQILTDSK